VALSHAEIEGLESAYPQIEDACRWRRCERVCCFRALYDAQAPDIAAGRCGLSSARCR